MNNKSKVITAILSILIIVLYFVNEKNDYKFDEASKANLFGWKRNWVN